MYALIQNGLVERFPYSLRNLRADNPNVSFPASIDEETLAAYGVVLVSVQETPPYDPSTHKVVQAAAPVLVDGTWQIVKTVAEKSQEEVGVEQEQAAFDAREERNNLLRESDWTQVPDAPVDREAWALYRQALRDITTQEGFPSNVVFPTKPE